MARQIESWEELGREVVFKKYSRRLESVDFRLPNGNVADFIIDARRSAVCVLGLTLDREVVLVRQFRPGPNMILDGMPGGFVDDGEDAHAAAEKEFKEETGYAGVMEHVGSCFVDAYSTMKRHCYVARDCIKVGEPEENETEKTEVILLPIDKFRDKLRLGMMTDVEAGYMGLDYLKLL